jgi:hypothetical protein
MPTPLADSRHAGLAIRTNFPVPAEARGLARLFRARVMANANLSTPLIEALFNELAAIVRRRGKPPRDETMTEIVRRWRQIPADNRIGALVIKQERRGHSSPIQWTIADTRLMASNINHVPEYGDINEIAVCLVTYALTTSPRLLPHVTRIPIATLNHHALGRRMERFPSQTYDASMLRDIASILAAAPELLTREQDFIIPTGTGDGQWKGMATNLRDVDGTMVAALHVRTYRRD